MAGYGPIVAAHLDMLRVPDSLKHQVDYGDSGPWPPRPGCSASPDMALSRLWARIDLAQWIDESPQLFGPHRKGELDRLAVVGTRLRHAGEGTRVLWGIDVVPTEQWVTHDSPGLDVVELICLGPHLPQCLVDEIDSTLSSIGWTYPPEGDVNSACTVNRTACFHTAWHDSIAKSANPARTSMWNRR